MSDGVERGSRARPQAELEWGWHAKSARGFLKYISYKLIRPLFSSRISISDFVRNLNFKKLQE